MFNSLKYALLGYLLLLFGWYSPAIAQNASVSRFTASPVAEQVLLDWVIAAGATCDGIGVYRGSDTVGMTLIHFIPGVCGDLARPVTYSYVDSFPLINQINYYRLELGPRVFTSAIAIALLNIGGQGYQFRPHPVTDQARLILAGEIYRNYQIDIYDSRGQRRKSLSFSGNDFYFETRELENGLYYFTLFSKDGKSTQQGKLLIQH